MLEKDIKYLNKIMNIKNAEEKSTNSFWWIYPFTNENIDGYFKNINFKDKTVLSVTSSGDHILNSIIYGAKEIDAFDINPLAKYYSALKIAAIKTLSLEEFIIFFYTNNINSYKYLTINLYNKIKIKLSGDYKLFWDYFFNSFTHKEITKSYLFSDDYLNIKQLCKVNKYLNRENYNKLKEEIEYVNINYYDIPFERLKYINKKYDVIILSNVIAFMNIEKNENILKEIKNIIESISYDNSKVVLSYLYGESLFTHAYEGVYDKKLLYKYFSMDDYKYLYFTSSDTVTQPKILKKVLYDKQDSVFISKTKKPVK